MKRSAPKACRRVVTGKDLRRVAFVRQFLTFSGKPEAETRMDGGSGWRVSGRSARRARRASRRSVSGTRRGAVAGARAAPLRPLRVGTSPARDVVKTRKIRSRLANVRMKRQRSRASRGDAPSFTLKILSRRGALASFDTSASSAPASASRHDGDARSVSRPRASRSRGNARASTLSSARRSGRFADASPERPARVVDELAVDAIDARVVDVDMACVLKPRTPL